MRWGNLREGNAIYIGLGTVVVILLIVLLVMLITGRR